MKPHIAFIVESAHGHINPTLGTASELVRRDYYVSHAVKDYFAPRVLASGSDAIVYRPLENKNKIFKEMYKERERRDFDFDFKAIDLASFKRLLDEEMEDTLQQLESCYAAHRPDLIIYDRTNLAGRSLALKWGIPTVEHSPMLIADHCKDYDPNLVIVSLPKFLQGNAETLDERFRFVGPVFTDAKVFSPWQAKSRGQKTILVSATTGLMPQPEYFRRAIEAFRDFPQHIVLSIGNDIEPAALGDLPPNCQINQSSSQREILENACLFVSQSGPSSILEALSCAVPLLLLPPSQVHDLYSSRIADLNMGVRLEKHEVSVESLRQSAINLLGDFKVSACVRRAKQDIAESGGAVLAADLIEKFLAKVY